MTDAIAMFAAGIAALALVVAAISSWYSYAQARAAARQATAAEETVRLQAEALRSQANDMALALKLAQESGEAAKASAEALQSQAQDTHAAIEIAKRNADSAERLAEANETLAISGYRGWLVMIRSPFTASHSPNQGFTVSGAICFRNVGRTPCTGIGVRYCQSFAPSAPNDFVEGSTLHHPIVSPDEEMEIKFEYTFSLGEFQQLQSEERRLFIYGNLHYTDVFGYYRGTHWRYEYHYGQNTDAGHGLFPCFDGNSFK